MADLDTATTEQALRRVFDAGGQELLDLVTDTLRQGLLEALERLEQRERP